MARSAKVGDVIIALKARTEEFTAKIDGAAKKFGKSLATLASPMSAVSAALEAVSPKTAKVAAGLGIAGIAFSKLANETLETVKAQNALSISLGANIEEVQRFERGFERAGTGVDSTRSALSKFDDLLSSAKLGSEDARARLEGLGLSLEALQGQSSTQAFAGMLSTVAKLNGATAQQAALQGVVGDSAKELVKTTSKGAGELNRLLATSEVLGEAASNKLMAYGDLVKQFTVSTREWGEMAADTVVPALQGAFFVVDKFLKGWLAIFQGIRSVVDLVLPTSMTVKGMEASTARQNALQQAASESAALQVKRSEANLKVQGDLRQGERDILAFRNDYLKIQQDINVKHAEASKEIRGQLVAQKVQIEQQKINAELLDKQVEIGSLVDHELALRYKITKEMQLATASQKEQAFFLQRQLDLSTKLEESRQGGSVGGRDFLASRQINDMAKYTDATKAELDSMKIAAENALKEGLGDSLTYSDLHKGRVAAINADLYLNDDEKKRAIGNADRQQVLDKRTFLEGLGKIIPPAEKFQQTVEALKIDLDKKRISQDEYDRLVSDNYKSMIGDQPKLAESLEVGSTALYDRLAKFYSGMEDRPIEKQIADNGKKAVTLLDKIERKTGTPTEKVQSIR